MNLLFKENLQLKSSIEGLKSDFSTLEAAYRVKEEQAERDDEKISELNKSVEHYTQTCRELFDKLETKSIQIKELQLNLDIKVAEAHDLQRELNYASSDLTRQKEELMSSNQNLNLIKKNILGLQTQLQKIQKEKEEMQGQLDLKARETKVLEEQINSLQNNVSHLQTKANGADSIYQEEIDRSKEALQALNHTHGSRDLEINNLKTKLAQAEDQINKAEIEKNQTADAYAMLKLEMTEISILKDTILEKEQELLVQRTKTEDYSKKMLELEQASLEMQKKHHREVEEISQQQRMIEEKNSVGESFERKEQIYKGQLEDLTKQLDCNLQQLSETNEEHRELYLKYEMTRKELEKRDEEIQEYIDTILNLKKDLDEYTEKSQKLNDADKIKQENYKLKSELKKKSEFINELSDKAKEAFQAKDEEINKIREDFMKSEAQHQLIRNSASIRESEALKYKEEVKLVLVEKSILANEIQE